MTNKIEDTLYFIQEHISTFIAIIVIITGLYTIIGSKTNISEIKRRVPLEIKEQNWEIIRYNTWAYGSWFFHGGKVYYHVKNTDNPNIQYQIYVSMWGGELQWHYYEPEKLERIDVDIQ